VLPGEHRSGAMGGGATGSPEKRQHRCPSPPADTASAGTHLKRSWIVGLLQNKRRQDSSRGDVTPTTTELWGPGGEHEDERMESVQQRSEAVGPHQAGNSTE